MGLTCISHCLLDPLKSENCSMYWTVLTDPPYPLYCTDVLDQGSHVTAFFFGPFSLALQAFCQVDFFFFSRLE